MIYIMSFCGFPWCILPWLLSGLLGFLMGYFYMNKWKGKFADMEAKYNSLRKVNADLDADLSACRSARATVEGDLATANGMVKEMKSSLSVATTELDDLRTQVKSSSLTTDDSAALKSSISQLNADISETRSINDKLASDNQSLTTANNKLTAENKNLTEANKKLSGDLESLQAEPSKLKDDAGNSSGNDELNSKVQSLTDANSKLTSENKSLADSNKKLSGDLESLKSENSKLKSDNEGLAAANESLKASGADTKSAGMDVSGIAAGFAAGAAAGATKDSGKESDDNKKEKTTKAPKKSSASSSSKVRASKTYPAIKSDNLQIIEGIGPKMESVLHDAGIKTWDDLSKKSAGDLRGLLDTYGDKYKIINPTAWPDQAKFAADEKWKELIKLQKDLDSGGVKGSGETDSKFEKLVSKYDKGAFAKFKTDDLKIVEGIGPKIAGLLNDAGIKTWAALSETPVSKIQEVLDKAGPRYKLARPNTWPKQAGLAAKGKWKELEKLQDELDGGR